MSSGEEEINAVVIDNGSCMIKAGFAGEDRPRSVFSTVVGIPRVEQAKPYYVGEKAERISGLLSMKHPIERGIIKDWDDMEKIWHHIFDNELRVAPEDQPVFLTDSVAGKPNREKMAKVMFEFFNTPAMYVGLSGLLTLYASGLTDGVALCLGDGRFTSVPVINGYPQYDAIETSEVAGDDITRFFNDEIQSRGLFFNESKWHTVRDIKEKVCYVSQNYESEDSKVEKKYELPDGETAIFGEECFRCPEALFKPSLHFKACGGIHELTYNSIMKCDADDHESLFGHIVLSGGTSLFAGLTERFHKEMTALAPSSTKVNIVAPPERMYTPWIGGSILASLHSFQSMLITKEEYDECGCEIVHRCM